MNISYVKNTTNKSVGNNVKEQSAFLSIGKKGQIVEGIISKVADKVSIDFGGKEVKVAKSSIPDAKQGELRKFEILDVSKDSIVLKEIESEKNTQKNQGIVCTSVEVSTTVFAEQLNQKESMESDDKEQESEEQLEDVKDKLTEEDYKALEEEGVSLEKYEAERLQRAITRIKRQRQEKNQSIENYTESKKSYQEQIKREGQRNAIKTTAGKYQAIISQKLEESNLPVTQENIEKIAQALELSNTASNLSDKAIAYMINNQLAPTIEHIYHAQYAGSSAKYVDYQAAYQNYQTSFAAYTSTYESAYTENTESAWELVEGQAKQIIEDAGLEVNDKTLGQAEWLFSNELPITKETLSALSELNAIKDNYNSFDMLEEIMNSYVQGIAPEQSNMSMKITNQQQMVKDFMEKVNALVKTMSQEMGSDINQVIAKRQLEEIRLKMTSDAGLQLMSKGITLDTSGLEKIVDGLRELEKEYYRSLLQEANVVDSDENIALLQQTTEKVNDLKEAPIYTLSVTYKNFDIQTLENLHNVGISLKTRLDKAENTYEALMTKPRKDMGDSIEKAFRNVDDLLKETGLEATNANRRAVRILGYNSMEITPENINQVKSYDEQVNQLFQNMQPAVVVEMIKEGINPLNIPVSELNEKISQIKDEMGLTEEERFSTFLRKLDMEAKHKKDGGLTEEERKAFIGIYRLVHQVEKSKGAAVGSVLDSGKDMTLNNLLTAVRTSKVGSMDKKIDDDFGALESATKENESITEQISYMCQVIKDIKEELSPDKLMNVIGENNILDGLENLKDESIEVLREQLKSAEQSQELEDTYGAEKIEEIRNLIDKGENAIAFLNHSHQPVTLHNLIAANQLLDGGKQLFQQLNNKTKGKTEQENNVNTTKTELSEETKIEGKTAVSREAEETKTSEEKTINKQIQDILERFSEDVENPALLQNDYVELEKRFHEMMDIKCDNYEITTQEYEIFKNMSQGIALAKTLSHQENYQIPILTGNTITSVNLTVINGTNESGKVSIQMDSDDFGKIDIEITVKNQDVKGYIFCNSNEGYRAFTKERETLKEALKEEGFELKQLDYGMDSKWKSRLDVLRAGEEKVETKTLYKAAKVFIKAIKNLEKKNGLSE